MCSGGARGTLAHLHRREIARTHLPERSREVYQPLLELTSFACIIRVKVTSIAHFFFELYKKINDGF